VTRLFIVSMLDSRRGHIFHICQSCCLGKLFKTCTSINKKSNLISAKLVMLKALNKHHILGGILTTCWRFMKGRTFHLRSTFLRTKSSTEKLKNYIFTFKFYAFHKSMCDKHTFLSTENAQK